MANRLLPSDDALLGAALLTTALALAPALAHLLELPNKIGLERDAYFIVQQIYRGWALLGFLLAVQLAAILGVVVTCWPNVWPRTLALTALAGLIAAQAVFWIWTYPANAATANWMTVPADWQALRHQWEFSHAAGAIFQLVSMTSLIVLAVTRRRPG